MIAIIAVHDEDDDNGFIASRYLSEHNIRVCLQKISEKNVVAW